MRVVELSPYQLTFLTTSQCTAACAHCSVRSSPERRDRLTFAEMRHTVDRLLERGTLKLVIFAGGEPTLVGEHLLDTIAYCDSIGLCTRVVTNASWAPTKSTARRKIEALRMAGLMELNLSADDYHLPYIAFRNIRNAWEASKGAGFSAVVIANAVGPQSKVTPDFIMHELGETIPLVYDDNGFKAELSTRADDGTLYGLSNAYLQNLGRSHSDLPKEVFYRPKTDDLISGPCPWAIQSAAVSPQNHLVACCGMEAEGNQVLDFGEICSETDMNALISKANDDVLVSAIAHLGPAWLLSLLNQKGITSRTVADFSSMCEICEYVVSDANLVSALRAHSPTLAATVLRSMEMQNAG